MSYVKTNWTDRRVETPNRYQLQDNGDGTFTLIPVQGDIIQHGTAISATNMNKIEKGIDDAHKNKVDKISGKGLSTNDYTTAEKNKLAGIQSGAQVNRAISDSVSSTSSSTAASSKAVKTAYDKANSAYSLANTKEPAFSKNTGFNKAKSDSVTSSSSSTVATSLAAKTAHDRANVAYAKGNDAYGKVTSASYLRDRLKTVDGSGSGLDADLLDGKHASQLQGAAAGTQVYGRTGTWLRNYNPTSDIMFRSAGYKTNSLAWDGTYLWTVDFGINYDIERLYRLNAVNGAVVSYFKINDGYPKGLAWDGTYIWSTGKQRDRISKYNVSGTVISYFGTPGTSGNGSLAWDGTYLYYTDIGTEKMYKLNTAGTIISSINIPYLIDIAWAGTYFWVIAKDSASPSISRMSTSGVLTKKYTPLFYNMKGIAWDGARIWVLDGDYSASYICRLNMHDYILVS